MFISPPHFVFFYPKFAQNLPKFRFIFEKGIKYRLQYTPVLKSNLSRFRHISIFEIYEQPFLGVNFIFFWDTLWKFIFCDGGDISKEGPYPPGGRHPSPPGLQSPLSSKNFAKDRNCAKA